MTAYFTSIGNCNDDIYEIGGKVICYNTRLTKCSNPSRSNKPIVFCSCTEDKLLCPVASIKEYLHTQFFITHDKPHHPISTVDS